MGSCLFVFGALFGFMSVVAGAFGAHFLKKKLDTPYKESTFQTGARYQMYHALILIIMGVLPSIWHTKLYEITGVFFVLGTLMFSLSLYVLVFKSSKFFAYMTPLGGVFLLLGWLGLIAMVIS
jgi:uncharacterized membrane protein YgdD (TMEM256/DUF423 family)